MHIIYEEMKPIRDIVRENGGIIKTSQLTSSAEYKRLLRAVKRGDLVRLHHGVYVEPSSLLNNMVDVESIIPNGVVCLYNAWAYHRLSTTVPPAFCIAIEANRKVSLNGSIPINLYYWKAEYFDFGITRYNVSGFTVRMTDVERSVCDAIKYRNKVGTDICAEVVRTYLSRSDRNISRLIEYAKKLRVEKILNNYLEVSLA